MNILKTLLFFLFLLLPLVASAEVQTFQLSHRSASDLLPSVRALLSDGEKATAAEAVLVVTGSADTLKAVDALVSAYDKPRRQLLLEVRQRLWKGSVPNKGARQIGTSQEDAYQQLRLLEGSTGTIAFTEAIPLTRFASYFAGRHQGFSKEIDWHRLSTGVVLKPYLLGDQVELQISPQLSAPVTDDAVQTAYRENSLQSTLVVPMAEWVSLGTSTQGGALTGTGDGGTQRTLSTATDLYDVQVRVHILK